MKYRPKHIAEYLLLRIFMLPITVLPYRLALVFGAGLAWLGHFVFRFRTTEARIQSSCDRAVGDDKIGL